VLGANFPSRISKCRKSETLETLSISDKIFEWSAFKILG
jgi:hypothetical protein